MAPNFISTAILALAAIATVNGFTVDIASPARRSALERRAAQVPVACYSDNNGECDCPIDNNGDTGVLINIFPGYQCAYPGGACTWDDKSGDLSNTAQTNCPSSAPCPSSGCVCPTDNNGDSGVLINTFKGFQCAYTGGACTWNSDGALSNTAQTNCPTYSKCVNLW